MAEFDLEVCKRNRLWYIQSRLTSKGPRVWLVKILFRIWIIKSNIWFYSCLCVAVFLAG